VQQAGNPDATRLQAIKNDVPTMLEAPQARANVVAWSAECGIVGQLLAASFETIQIADRLIASPSAHCVLADVEQIDFRSNGKANNAHRLCGRAK